MATDKRFVSLVQERMVLYNPKLKEHHNRSLVEKLWREIAEDMDITVSACKQKWTNLRNSYARHLRNQNKPFDSVGEHKPKWYLADALAFLKDHMHHRKSKHSLEREETEVESIQSLTVDSDEIQTDILKVENESTEASPVPLDLERHVRPKRLPPGQITRPRTFLRSSAKRILQEHPLLNYVKGLLPDYDSLTPRRQRIFKQNIVIVMNELMDEQEMEGHSSLSHSYTPLFYADSDLSAASGHASMQAMSHDQIGSDDN